MRHFYLGDFLRVKQDVASSNFTNQGALNYSDVFDLPTVIKRQVDDLIPHSGFGFLCEKLLPFFWKRFHDSHRISNVARLVMGLSLNREERQMEIPLHFQFHQPLVLAQLSKCLAAALTCIAHLG